ncbi:MAG: TetR/AcrR family transcriptional regulator [Desulfobulbaceae bacterium]|nr:TetR/AcrR family transcriptional regulator [Desulfobulbaceae bacterium]
MNEKRTARRQEYKDRQRQEIMNEALELFSARGYHQVSMQDIAHEAEFAVGTLYKFFKNKEELYRAIILNLSEKFSSALGQALEQGKDEYERLLNYLKIGGEIFMANTQAVSLYFIETRGAGFNLRAGLDEEVMCRYDQILEWLSKVFAAGIENGIFRPLDPDYLARSLDSLACTFLFAWLDDSQKYPYEKSLRMMDEIFFHNILVADYLES